MVYGAALEKQWSRKRPVGSNPTSSAKLFVMKILKTSGSLLILNGCTLEKNYLNDETCILKFYGSGGAFSNDCTEFEISKPYDEIETFILGEHKVMNCSFYKRRHNE